MSCIEEYFDEEWARGYAIGKTGVILELIDDNTISIEKGAEFLGISVQEMLQRYSEYKANR
jgi:hypothetical protein